MDRSTWQRKQIKLFDPQRGGSNSGQYRLNDADLLSAVEQQVMTQPREGLDSARAGIELPASQYLLQLSAMLSERSAFASSIPSNSSLHMLTTPVCFVEFRRSGKKHHAYVAPGDLERLTRRGQSTLGVDALIKLDQEFKDIDVTIKQFDDETFRQSASARSYSDLSQPEALLQTQDHAPDLLALMRPLSGLLSRNVRNIREKMEAKVPIVLDTDHFLRSNTLSWLNGFAAIHQDSAQNTAEEETRGDNFQSLPVIYAGTLACAPNTAFVLAVSSTDAWFVDDSIDPDIGAMPGISLGLYDVSKSRRSDAQSVSDLRAVIKPFLSSLTAKLIAQSRGEVLASAAGEGSKIARWWFGKGVADLLSENTAGGLSNEDPLDFWTRFVRELLCADIPGVSATETFPFDRAFIVADTGAAPSTYSSANGIRLRALEAAIESNAPQDRFEYKVSNERTGRDLETEFNVTSKTIKYEYDFHLRRQTDGSLQISQPVLTENYTGAQNFTSLIDVLRDRSFADTTTMMERSGGADQALEAMIGDDSQGDDGESHGLATRASNINALRALFSREGFLYDFTQRVKFKDDYPLTHAINSAYLKLTGTETGVDTAGISNNSGVSSKVIDDAEAKVVLISFEPQLSQENRRNAQTGVDTASGQYLESEQHKITIILIADEDTEKSISDLTSEREDLRLLTEMIFRQRLRDRIREVDFLEKRVEVVSSLVDMFLHKFKYHLPDDDDIRAELDVQW
ncbi:MAG: hypothetical protein AAGJ50_04780, partial [Pseudomonadota bacterium]